MWQSGQQSGYKERRARNDEKQKVNLRSHLEAFFISESTSKRAQCPPAAKSAHYPPCRVFVDSFFAPIYLVAAGRH